MDRPLTTNVPYGYVKDKENPQTWLIDAEAASVAKSIFEMCMNGRGPSQIANQLKADGVLTPTAYKDRQGIKSPNTAPENPCGWHGSTVVAMLERREYTGCTVNFKTYTNSIWDKKQRDTPIEKQAIFEDTLEAIIEKDIFDKVPIAVRSCTTEPLTTANVRERSSIVRFIGNTRTSAEHTSSVSPCWNEWC